MAVNILKFKFGVNYMYCRYCGKELDEDGLCEKCGIIYETQPQQPPVVYVNTPQEEREEPRTSGMAVAGFVMAVLQCFLDGNISVILYWLAMIFSFVGMAQTRNREMRGRGFAIWGLIITLTPFILGIIEGYLTARGY